MKYRLAILSTNKPGYSETFIKAHRDFLEGEKYYYYGGYIPFIVAKKNNASNNKTKDPFHLLLKIWKKYKKYIAFFIYPLLFIYARTKLKQLLKKNKIDVVLAEYGPTGASVTTICKQLDIPLIVHFHGFDATRQDTVNKYKQNYQTMFDYATSIIAVSQRLKQSIIQLGCQENKIVISPCGANPEFYKIQPDYQSHNFIFIGRFIDVKAPHYLIESFKRVSEKYANATLTLIGEGEELQKCKDLAETYNLQKKVIFTGKLTQLECIQKMKESFCYVQHCITNALGQSEASSVSLKEAHAAGLPIVSTLSGGNAEIVIQTKTGFLVEEHDVKTFAEYMIQLYRDRDLVKTIGSNGKEHYLKNLTLEKHINTLNRVIQKAYFKT